MTTTSLSLRGLLARVVLDQLKCFQALGLVRKSLIPLITCSVVMTACGGGGVSTDSMPADVSLVVGFTQTFNGVGAQARISGPKGAARDSEGNTYITETGLHSVRKISPTGVVTVFAGDPVDTGFTDGAGTAARFLNPGAIAIDKNDNVYVLDTGNYTVRKITSAGLVTTLAGGPGLQGGDDGQGAAARFFSLETMAVDPSGVVFVSGSQVLRKIAVDGTVSTLNVAIERPNSVTMAMASDSLDHLASDSDGNLFIASGTFRSAFSLVGGPSPVLYKLTPAGVLTKVYEFSTKDEDGAVFNFGGIAVDAVGDVYLSNGSFTSSASPNISYTSIGNTILKLSPEGTLTTIAGTRGDIGFSDGNGLAARFDTPGNLAVDRLGNLVVADVGNNTIRVIASDGAVSTLAGRASASVDGQGSAAQLKAVVGLASDQRGNVVLAERYALRRLSASGMLTTLTDYSGKFQNLALDSRGYMYVANYAGTFSNTLQFAPNGVPTNAPYRYYPSSLAVNARGDLFGFSAGSGDSLTSITNLSTGESLANLGEDNFATAFVFDAAGNAYAANGPRSNILKISPTGAVSVLAGMSDNPGYKDGSAQTAQFNDPQGIAVIGSDVYVADTGNNLIRKISQDGTVTTVAGTPGSLDTVMGTVGALYRPTYLAAQSNSALLVVVDGQAIVRVRLQ